MKMDLKISENTLLFLKNYCYLLFITNTDCSDFFKILQLSYAFAKSHKKFDDF